MSFREMVYNFIFENDDDTSETPEAIDIENDESMLISLVNRKELITGSRTAPEKIICFIPCCNRKSPSGCNKETQDLWINDIDATTREKCSREEGS